MNTIIKNGLRITEKTQHQYKKLWKYFLKNHEEKFKEEIGYGKEEIKRIGTERFIDFYDWNNIKEIDQIDDNYNKVLICNECGNDFALFPTDFGICQDCLQLYDIDKLYFLIEQEKNKSKKTGIITDILSPIILFAFDQEFRKGFQKK